VTTADRVLAGAYVGERGLVDHGWLRIAGGRIAELGVGAAPEGAQTVVGTLVPGFVDTHCHGGGGHAIYSGEPADVVAAAATHLARGTTSLIASVATRQLDRMRDAVAVIRHVVEQGNAPNVVGIHLEGPFLSPARSGAQDRAALRDPDVAVLEDLLAAGGGLVRSVTIAPELPGAIGLIERFADRLVVAVGHTDADAGVVTRAVDAGARIATHLFNAMPPLTARAPGPIGALLTDERVRVELVGDGHHVDPLVARLVLRAAGAERVALVTDAMAAAGLGDGDYAFAERRVRVHSGVARISGTDTIAGSTLLLGDAVRRIVHEWGGTLEDAVAMTAVTPAAAYEVPDRGVIRVDAVADLVVLDADLRVGTVLHAGTVVAQTSRTGSDGV
jgi:N-acetylglucosamine-6-phosphate deacetylase